MGESPVPVDADTSPAKSSRRRLFLDGEPGVSTYRLLTSLVVPRPIAWVSTESLRGIGNIAPHSFFTVASGKPPVVMFSSTGFKDTVRNIGETREFVVNVVAEALTDLANDSSAPFESSVDEAEYLGIAMEPSDVVSVRRVVDSPASIECRLHSLIEIGEATMVLGHVVAVTVREEILVDDQHPDIRLLKPMSRLGSNEWGSPPVPVAVNRPTDPDQVAQRSASIARGDIRPITLGD
jgi:flavin reductase (DIM6/NTAB) family NADH-FMN oxidoreductase RutF